MGQTESTQQIQKTYQIVYTKDNGNLLLKHKRNNNQFLLRTFSTFLQDQLAGFQKLIEKRRKVKSSHLLDIVDIKKQEQQRTCSILYKMFILLEYPFKTLQDQIQQRKMTTPKSYFNQNELWSILYSCSVAIHTLYANNFTHQALSLAQIYVDRSGLIKISDPLILGLQKNYIKVLKKNTERNVQLSPEIMSFLQDCNFFYYQKQKSDVYILGLNILEVAVLKRIEIYDSARKKANLELVDQYLMDIRQKYSYKFVQVLEQMLNREPKYRPMMIDIVSKIEEENSVRNQTYQSSTLKSDNSRSIENSMSEHGQTLFQRSNSQSYNNNQVRYFNRPQSQQVMDMQIRNQQKIQVASKPMGNLKNKALGKQGQDTQRKAPIQKQQKMVHFNNVAVSVSNNPSNLASINHSATKYQNDKIINKVHQRFQASNQYDNNQVKGLSRSINQNTKSTQFLHIGKNNQKTKLSLHKPVNLSNKTHKSCKSINQKPSIIKKVTSPVQQYKPDTPQFTNEKDFSHIQERYSYMNFGNITINYRPPQIDNGYQIGHHEKKTNTFNQPEIFENPLKKVSAKKKKNTTSVPALNSLFYSSPYSYNEKKLVQNDQNEQTLQNFESNQLPAKSISTPERNQQQLVHHYQQHRQIRTIQSQFAKNNTKKVLSINSPKDYAKYQNKSQQYSAQKRSFLKSDSLHPQNVSLDRQSQQPVYVIENYGSGGRYQGFKSKGKKNGQGRYYYKNGGFYDGNWVDNKMQGYGKLYFASGQLSYEGNWAADQFSGYGRIFNDRIQKFEGSFDAQNFEILGNKWLYYQGNFQNDSKHGKGKIKLANGEVFEGTFFFDMIQGDGVFYYLNGSTCNGTWKQNKLIRKS